MKKGDIPLLESWFSDPETCQLAFGVRAHSEGLDRLRAEYIQELKKDRSGVLMIRSLLSADKGNDIGFLRFKTFKKARIQSARIGILLGRNESRGQGFGQEAVQTLLDYLFETANLDSVELDTADFNFKAQNCFKACGFCVSHSSEVIGIHNDWKEQRLVMKLSRESWQDSQQGSP